MADKGPGPSAREPAAGCPICPHIKAAFTSPEQEMAHKKSKKHLKNEARDLRLRSAKINIHTHNPQKAIAKITEYFLKRGYGTLEDVQAKPYPNGTGFLLVVMESEDGLKRAADDNPHNLPGLRFAIKPVQMAAPVMESEGDKVSEVLSELSSCKDLDEQMRRLYCLLSLDDKDHAIRRDFMFRIQSLCKNSIQELAYCWVYAFGSSVNRLGIKNCDLDMVLLTNGDVTQRWLGALPDNQLLIKKLRSLFFKHQNALQLGNIVGIPGARIPVVKFSHVPTQINGDVSFNRRAGILNSQLIGALMDFSPSAKYLTFFVRLWGKRRGFVGGGGQKINSYTITLMCVFYLQQVNVLPALQPLKNKYNTIIDESAEIFFLQGQWFHQLQEEMLTISLDELLRGFCEFYLRYDFSEDVISILHGYSLSCSKFSDTFPVGLLNVQDPFETSFNTARHVQTRELHLLRQSLLNALIHPNLTQPAIPNLTQPAVPNLNRPAIPNLIQPTIPNLTQPTIPNLTQLVHPTSEAQPAEPTYEAQPSHPTPGTQPTSNTAEPSHPISDTHSSDSTTEWGVQLLLKPTTPDEDKNKSKPISLAVPYRDQLSPGAAYFKLCVFIISQLRDLYRMKFTECDRSHVISEAISSKKRLSSASELEDANKRRRLVHNANSENSGVQHNPDVAEEGASESPKDIFYNAELGPSNDDITKITPIFTQPVPIEHYVAYNTSVTSRHDVFGQHQDLENFNYDKYLESIKEKITKIDETISNSKETCPNKFDFRLSLEPTDSQFRAATLWFSRYSQPKVNSVVTHLTKVLPEALQRAINEKTY